MARRRGKSGSGNSIICDRSGFRYRASEMVVEEGTGYVVHKGEDDGAYNLVTHPLNRPSDFAGTGDPFPSEIIRTEVDFQGIFMDTYAVTSSASPVTHLGEIVVETGY